LDTRLARLTQLQQLLRLQQEQLTVTREASTLAAADYQAGIVTNLEFLAAQQDLSANRLQIRQTRLAIRLTLIDIYARTGQIEKINEITGE
ncbi:MAG: TolC family protein, partial [Calditrichaeota bacterium]|nr:TolC family protein [Calditrichota bacterium]